MVAECTQIFLTSHPSTLQGKNCPPNKYRCRTKMKFPRNARKQYDDEHKVSPPLPGQMKPTFLRTSELLFLSFEGWENDLSSSCPLKRRFCFSVSFIARTALKLLIVPFNDKITIIKQHTQNYCIENMGTTKQTNEALAQ